MGVVCFTHVTCRTNPQLLFYSVSHSATLLHVFASWQARSITLYLHVSLKQCTQFLQCHNGHHSSTLINYLVYITLPNVDDGDTVPTPVTTVLSLQNLMDANKFLVLFNVI